MSIFSELHNRKNTRSVKWDMLEPVFQSMDVLPMWVADMDFKAPEAVNNALIKRAEHGIYGYTMIDHDVENAIIDWVNRRHQWEINREWLTFSPGVVTSLHMAIQAFTKPQDKVLIQTPVYGPFYNVIESHERELVKNQLIYKDHHYSIDFHDLEEKLKTGVKAFVLCSPHNPVGRVWKKAELEEMARLCIKYDVLIIADEIHADLVLPGNKHIPIASLSEEIAENTITMMAPSKTFNLAGLQASFMVTKNKDLRLKLKDSLDKQGFHMLNTMGNTAIEAAYNHGQEWLDELLTVIADNKNYVMDMFAKHTPELKVIDPEGTYLLWIDCSSLNMDDKELKKFMVQHAKVGLNAGADYGVEGDQFMRMNVGCPKSTVEEGVKRIMEAVSALQEK